jgi:hypothetical protein
VKTREVNDDDDKSTDGDFLSTLRFLKEDKSKLIKPKKTKPTKKCDMTKDEKDEWKKLVKER